VAIVIDVRSDDTDDLRVQDDNTGGSRQSNRDVAAIRAVLDDGDVRLSIPVEIPRCTLRQGLGHKRGEPWRPGDGRPECRPQDEHGERETGRSSVYRHQTVRRTASEAFAASPSANIPLSKKICIGSTHPGGRDIWETFGKHEERGKHEPPEGHGTLAGDGEGSRSNFREIGMKTSAVTVMMTASSPK
jgi:hypothetical protein